MSAFYTLLFVAPTSDAELIALDTDEQSNQRYPNAWLNHIGDLELIELWNLLVSGTDAATLLEDMVYASPDGEVIVAEVPAAFIDAVNGIAASDMLKIVAQWRSSEIMTDWSQPDLLAVFNALSIICKQSADTTTPVLQVHAL
jgi:hypothetical protein